MNKEFYVKVNIPHIVKVKADDAAAAMANALAFLKYSEVQPHDIQVIDEVELPDTTQIEGVEENESDIRE